MEAQPVLVCDLTAIPRDERKIHSETVVPRIFDAVDLVEELSDGYAFLFCEKPDMFGLVTKFVENERKCCSFIGFHIEIEPGNRNVWLRITGGEGVKEFLRTSLADIPAAIKANRIKTGGDNSLKAAVLNAGKALNRTLKDYL